MRWLLPILFCLTTLPAQRPRELREVVGLVAAAKGTQLMWVQVDTRTCRRRTKLLPGHGLTLGAGRPGTVWIVQQHRVVLCDVRSGVVRAVRPLPKGMTVRAVCSVPVAEVMLLADGRNRLFAWTANGWRHLPAWRPPAERIVGMTVDPVKRHLFVATHRAGKGQVLWTDLGLAGPVRRLAVPICGCYEVGKLTGIVWDGAAGLLYATDGKTIVSSRLARSEREGWHLGLRNYCELRTARVTGLAVVAPPVRTELHGQAVAGLSLGTLVMKGIPTGPGFVDFGVGSEGARMSGGRMVGGGQSVVLAVPPDASLIGAGMRLRWRTQS
ncbi:MAG: hypothetical protein ACYTF5_18615, partial [Planctomycetota bacterium]